MTSHSRGLILARVLQICCPSLVKRAQGKPGADCARSPMCVGVLPKCTRVKPQVQPRHPGFPRAMALRLIRALPGEAAFLAPVAGGTYRQRSARVAAPGPHDFAVRCKRFAWRAKARLTPQRPSQPAPTFRDDRVAS